MFAKGQLVLGHTIVKTLKTHSVDKSQSSSNSKWKSVPMKSNLVPHSVNKQRVESVDPTPCVYVPNMAQHARLAAQSRDKFVGQFQIWHSRRSLANTQGEKVG